MNLGLAVYSVNVVIAAIDGEDAVRWAEEQHGQGQEHYGRGCGNGGRFVPVYPPGLQEAGPALDDAEPWAAGSHWVASAITGPALLQTRHIAAELAGTRGWNPRIVIETGRALAVILASHQAGDMIAWSALPPALRPRDLSVTRTAEILQIAGLLHDDRVPSFTSLMQARLAVLPAPMATSVEHWLRTRSEGAPAAGPATSTPSG